MPQVQKIWVLISTIGQRAVSGEERFAVLKNGDPACLAHEFFNAAWHVTWFPDVAEQLAEAKLDFGASARIRDNLDDFRLTPDAAGWQIVKR